jgi:3-oxoacid CoA-transferase subunit A
MPWRYDHDGNIAIASPPKPTHEFDGAEHVLERAIIADFGLVRAWKGDRHGNLIYKDAPATSTRSRRCAASSRSPEVEHLVEPGELDPNQIHTPGAYVHQVLALTPEQAGDKRIEKVTVREAGADGVEQRTDGDPCRVRALRR